MAHRSTCWLLGAAAVLAPLVARADAATEARLRDALRSATAQVRTLEDEKASWAAKEAALQKEVGALREQARTAGVARRPDREVADLKKQLAEVQGTNQKLIEATVKCQGSAREQLDAGRVCEEDRSRLAAQFATLSGKLNDAEARNERLFRVGKDIIDWLAQVGVGAAIAAREPFLGLKRVELENAAQSFEDQLHEQRNPPAGATQPQAAAAPEPQRAPGQ
jgi:chromosome segregation ATPase